MSRWERSCLDRLPERFASFVSPCPVTGCWWWTGRLGPDGYGRLSWGDDPSRMSVGAHRYAFFGGDTTAAKSGHSGAVVMHSCDQRTCVNPAHLRLGTTVENNADRHRKKRDAMGEAHGSAKLTTLTAETLLVAYATGVFSARELARWWGVTDGAVRMLVKGKTWRHLGQLRAEIAAEAPAQAELTREAA